MYALTGAIGKAANGSGRWANIDLTTLPLRQIYSTYRRVWAFLTNSFLSQPVALDLDLIRTQVGTSNKTLSVWLSELGTASLPTTTTLPVLAPRYAKYADAFHAGYKVRPVKPGAAIDAASPVADKTDLHLSRANTDYNLFLESCLVNVNGFYHFIDGGSDGIFVKDGMRSKFVGNQNHLGILSFREIGKLRCIPITEAMIYKQHTSQVFKDRCFIDLGEDVANKSVLLVIGGYLHVLDQKTFFRVSATSFMIDFANFPLVDRYYESRPYLDLSGLPLETTQRNPSQIGIANLHSDAVIRAYLTMSQSFFVVIDNPDLFVEHDAIRSTTLPNKYISYTPPLYPLVVGVGKVGNYWYTPEDGQYALTCVDSLRQRRLFDTVDVRNQVSVSRARIPEYPTQMGQAHFLKIGTDLQTA